MIQRQQQGDCVIIVANSQRNNAEQYKIKT